MSAHRINLKGPWHAEIIALLRGGDAIHRDPETVRLPTDWSVLFGDCSGTVEFRRGFHSPSNLDHNTLVRIGTDACGGCGAVFLNGHALGEIPGTADGWQFEVSRQLEAFNQLCIRLEVSEETSGRRGLWAPVYLEIEEPPDGLD